MKHMLILTATWIGLASGASAATAQAPPASGAGQPETVVAQSFKVTKTAKWFSKTAPLPPGQPDKTIWIDPGCPSVEDALKELVRLQPGFPFALHLYTPKVMDHAVLKYLGELKQLRSLILHGPWAADESLPHLAALDQVQVLELGCTPYLSARELTHLAGLKNLKALRLYQCWGELAKLDAAAPALAALQGLQALEITYGKMSDQGLKQLAGMRQLQTLFLRGEQLTDEGLQTLSGLKQLRELSLYVPGGATGTTEAGRQNLQQALPGLEVLVRKSWSS
jgi:hypothetical protein